MTDCGCEVEIQSREQTRVLVLLLAINGVMFVAELFTGIVAQSAGLLADSLDMLADAIVYGIALYAVGRAETAKIHAALLSGVFQIVLALTIAGDVMRRFVFGNEPESFVIIAVGFVALLANAICLALISRHQNGEVHMRASWIFSKNDVIANIGVIVGGTLVYALDTHLPDLIVGGLIVLIVLRGGITIVNDARHESTLLSQ